MMNTKIFSIDELRAVTDAGYMAKKNKDLDWKKYLAKTESGDKAYEKFLFNLSDRGQDYFEECMDVAVNDNWDTYQRLEAGTANEKADSEINGWIEAAFEEFLDD